MAALQTIRNHGAALVGVVGVAMLAFIMGDFLNSGSSFFNRSRENVGEVAGHNIHYTEYEKMKDQVTEFYKMRMQRNDFNEDEYAQMRNEAWNLLSSYYAFEAQAGETGLTVAADELKDMKSRQQLPAELTASCGAFIDKSLYAGMMQQKLGSLLQALVRPNSLEAKYAFDARQTTANVEYVFRPYYTVGDSLVKVSESAIKRLYNKEKSRYKQTPNRAISYVAFNIVPSEEDFAAAQELMVKLEAELRATDDVALVVNTNSDLMYDARDYSAETIPAEFKDFAFGKDAKKDAFRGLEFNAETNTYSMARIVECGYSLPDSVELKAIAPKDQEGVEDQELGWFQASQLNPDMAEKAFHTAKGGRFTVSFGLNEQEFEVLEVAKATPKAKVAILTREVTPSSRTYSVLYNQAKQFVVNNNTEDAFRAAANEAGMTIYPQYNLTKNTDKVAQLKSSRPIVRWAFEAKDGEVSDVFECGDQFIVAVLQEINDGEYRSLESVHGELSIRAMNEAKAEYIKKELKGLNTLEEMAEKMAQPIRNAENVSLSSNRFGQQGNEPAVIGAALALEPNQTSAAIEGVSGVYVVRCTAKTTAEAEYSAEDEKAQLAQRYSYSLPYQAMQILQDEAKVVDNRANFQ